MGIESFGIAEVKPKICSIRNAYALELTKMKKSQYSGACADELYTPKVPWFSVVDKILKQVVQIRETQASEIEIELDDSIENIQSAIIEEVLSPSSNDLSVAKKSVPQRLTANIIASKGAQKRASSTDKALQGLQEKPNREEDNEFDCFGKSVACSLKKLPETVALESMAYIHSYLMRQRLTLNAQQIIWPSSSASSTTYEYAAIPSSNLSYYYNNTLDTNLH